LPARREPRDQIVEWTGMNEPDRRNRLAIAPGAALDDEAGGALVDVELSGLRLVGIARGNAVLRFGPWHMLDQPGARRHGREILAGAFRHRIQVEDPVFQRERPVRGVMTAAQSQDLCANAEFEPRLVVARRGALLSLQQ